mmetsp:Transcript_15265/g.30616  ORF Transcript_15265/g.30616 Transcript_15265/m.30616 type:complete len:531 (-) Transcript_15265:240-1832(-)
MTSFHRSDPLDIPFIDHHIIIRLLFPRIIHSIKWIFPRLYLDWTTGTDAPARGTDGHTTAILSSDAKKRFLEILLKLSLLLGSAHRLAGMESTAKNGHLTDSAAVWMATPAMKSSGMFLRPVDASASKRGDAKHHRRPSRSPSAIHSMLQHFQTSVIRPYGKILALAVVTVLIPAIHQEIKIWRESQLERREREWRLGNLRRLEQDVRTNFGNLESRSDADDYAANNNEYDVQILQSPTRQQSQLQWQHQTPEQLLSSSRQQNLSQEYILRLRSQRRKSRIVSFVTETILGFTDVVLPPLKLINYVSYLWGFNNTPDLGMKLCGWEYASVHDFEEYIGRGNSSIVGGNTGQGNLGSVFDFSGMQQYQRHANFQYGNRRLMVEEFLRTVSVVAPPRREGNGLDGSMNTETEGRFDRNVDPNASRNRPTDAVTVGGARSTSSSATGTKSWFKKRFLSFMGVVEENKSDADLLAKQQRHTLTCAKCLTENPAIPYITSCGHCYCYICLRMAVTDDLYFKCLECGKSIASSGRP